MPYITSVERIGYKRGRAEGLQKGIQEGIQQGQQQALRSALLEALATRFGEVDDLLRERIQGVDDPDRLRTLLRHAILSPDLAAFRAHLTDA